MIKNNLMIKKIVDTATDTLEVAKDAAIVTTLALTGDSDAIDDIANKIGDTFDSIFDSIFD